MQVAVEAVAIWELAALVVQGVVVLALATILLEQMAQPIEVVAVEPVVTPQLEQVAVLVVLELLFLN
jgi:hypothetical protein